MSDPVTVETAVQLARIEGKIDLQTAEMTHTRRAMDDQKADVAAMKLALENKADKAEFKALWGHITKGVWIVLGAVITALVAMVVKTHAG
jgi:hypothetical protein